MRVGGAPHEYQGVKPEWEKAQIFNLVGPMDHLVPCGPAVKDMQAL